MSKHTKCIPAEAPRLVDDSKPWPLQSHVSILKDLDPAHRASASTRGRGLLAPMLALSAVTGGVAAWLVAGFFSAGTHPLENISTASPSAALQMPVVAELKQTGSVALDRPPELTAPSVESAAAVILETPQLHAESQGPAPAILNAERLSSSHPAAVAAVSKTPARNAEAFVKPGATRKSGSGEKKRLSKPLRHASAARNKPSKDEVVDKAAAERDVDIITAIVKDVGR
jgi:hypothetical protein